MCYTGSSMAAAAAASVPSFGATIESPLVVSPLITAFDRISGGGRLCFIRGRKEMHFLHFELHSRSEVTLQQRFPPSACFSMVSCSVAINNVGKFSRT